MNIRATSQSHYRFSLLLHDLTGSGPMMSFHHLVNKTLGGKRTDSTDVELSSPTLVTNTGQSYVRAAQPSSEIDL